MDTYEKAYKEALERMESWARGEHPECFSEAQKAAEFGEDKLKESKDERIKRAFLEYYHNSKSDTLAPFLPCSGITCDDIIAWLEKQGEQKHYQDGINEVLNNLEKYGLEEQKDPYHYKQWLDWMERQTGHNYREKVEPKFKVGDFVVNDYCLGKVIELTDDAYLLDTGQGIPFSCEHNAHLWTINDAKDGDVLFTTCNNSNEMVFIYHGIEFDASKCYFLYSHTENECKTFNSVCSVKADIRPATKEQRDLLFQKMHEAGYEWDADKLELKKVEQQPTWSEEDEFQFNTIYHYLDLKKELYKKEGNNNEVVRKEEQLKWFKSLKSRITWKPSKDQLTVLSVILNYVLKRNDEDTIHDYMILKSLYDDLKKLKR